MTSFLCDFMLSSSPALIVFQPTLLFLCSCPQAFALAVLCTEMFFLEVCAQLIPLASDPLKCPLLD